MIGASDEGLKGSYKFDEFELDLSLVALAGARGAIDVPPKPFELLVLLLRSAAANRVVTKELAIEALWPNDKTDQEVLAARLAQHKKTLNALLVTNGGRKEYIERGKLKLTVPVKLIPAAVESRSAIEDSSMPPATVFDTGIAAPNEPLGVAPPNPTSSLPTWGLRWLLVGFAGLGLTGIAAYLVRAPASRLASSFLSGKSNLGARKPLVLIANLDQDCRVEPKVPFANYIKRELQDRAAAENVSIEVRVLPASLRSDEPRESALRLITQEQGDILFWGGYSCTRTDIDFDFRVVTKEEAKAYFPASPLAVKMAGDDWFEEGPRQAPIAVLDNLLLQKFTARSLAGLSFLMLSTLELKEKHCSQAQRLADMGVKNLHSALNAAEGVATDPERTILVAGLNIAAASRWCSGTERRSSGSTEAIAREAKSLVDEALSLNPSFAFTHFSAGVSHFMLSENQGKEDANVSMRAAINAFNTALRLDPTLVPAQLVRLQTLTALADATTGKEQEQIVETVVVECGKSLAMGPSKAPMYGDCAFELPIIQALVRGSQPQRVFDQIMQAFSQANGAAPDYFALESWGVAMLQRARLVSGKEAKEFRGSAIRKFEEVVQLKPERHFAYELWATCLKELASESSGEDAVALYLQAAQKFRKGGAIRQDALTLAQSAFSLGKAAEWRLKLCEVKHQGSNCPDASSLYTEAAHQYGESFRVKEYGSVYVDWAILLKTRARLVQGPMADEIRAEAIGILSKAQKVDPQNWTIPYHRATILFDQSLVRHGEEMRSLLMRSSQHFQEAFKLNPQSAEVLLDWGICLYHLGYKERKPILEPLVLDAIGKFEQAAQLAPQSYVAHFAWSTALLSLATAKEDPERRRLVELSNAKQAVADILQRKARLATHLTNHSPQAANP